MADIDAQVMTAFDICWPPDGAQQSALRQHRAGMGDQMAQQSIFERRQTHRFAGARHDAVGHRHHPGADRRQRHLGLAALEHLHAELVLQLADGQGQRRLADEAALGGAAEVQFPGDGDDVAQRVEVHGGF